MATMTMTRPPEADSVPVGPGFRLVKSEIITITPKIAKEYRDMEASPTERDFKQRHGDYLYKEFKHGRAHRFSWAYAMFNGAKVRMNAQHSSWALCKLADEGNWPSGTLMACVDEYAVDSKEALAALFRTFDPPASTRNAADVSGAYQGLYEDLKGVSKKIAQKGAEGINWYRSRILNQQAPTGMDRYSIFAEEGTHPYFLWLEELQLPNKAAETLATPVLACMYGTWTLNEPAAREFWMQVVTHSTMSDEELPSSKLDAFLLLLKDTKCDDRPTPSPEQLFGVCATCWNAYREEREIRSIRWDVKKVPELEE